MGISEVAFARRERGVRPLQPGGDVVCGDAVRTRPGVSCLAHDNEKKPERPAATAFSRLTFPKIAFFTLALATVSYLFRIVVPYGTSLLEFPSLAYLPQYLGFFLIGILADRRGWLRSIPGSLG